jgi:hypothetical protein
MGQCDALAGIVPADTDIWVWAVACGGRGEPTGERCVERFPEAPDPVVLTVEDLSAPGLDLAEACEDGSLEMCDELASLESSPPELGEYGRTCGGRTPTAVATTCAEELGASETLPEPASAEGLDEDLRGRLDELAYDCLGFDLRACDALAGEAPGGYEPYRAFGASCGERLPAPSGSCADEPELSRIPPATAARTVEDETEAELRELSIWCGRSEYERCAELVERAEGPASRTFREYGRTCGGLDEEDRPEACLLALGQEAPVETQGPTEPDRPTTMPDGSERPPPVGTLPPAPTTTLPPLPTTLNPPSTVAPPTPPVDPALPEPTAREDELLEAIRKGFEAHVTEVYEVRIGEGLRVGGAATVFISLRKPVTLELPPRVGRIAGESGRVTVEVNPVLALGDARATPSDAQPKEFVVQVRARRLDLRTGDREIGRFEVSPQDAGMQSVWLLFSDLRIDGRRVGHSFYVPVGGVEVGGRPLKDRILDIVLGVDSAAGIISKVGGAAVVLFAFYRWLRRRKNGETGQQPLD